MENTQTELKYEAPYTEKVSRLFIFRFLWIYVEIWVLMVWGMWIGLIMFVEFWYMLLLGKRSKGLWEKKLRFMRHINKWQSYLNALTDMRPKLIED